MGNNDTIFLVDPLSLKNSNGSVVALANPHSRNKKELHMKNAVIIGKKEDIAKVLEELDEEQNKDTPERKVPNPFKIEVRKPKSDDKYTSISEIKDSYSDQFVVDVEHEGRQFKFLCNRIPLFQLLPDQLDREAGDATMRMAYEDALSVIFGTVIPPDGEEFTYEDIENMPVMLVIRINNAILDEISPGFGFRIGDDDDDDDDVSEETNEEGDIELELTTSD